MVKEKASLRISGGPLPELGARELFDLRTEGRGLLGAQAVPWYPRCETMAKILIVDDSAAVLGAARTLLEGAGHTVLVQSSPAGLPAIISRERPDLILLDVKMPMHDGDQILRAIRARGWLADCTVLLFSAKPVPELAQLVTACGADGYISKSCGGPAMIEAVNAHLAKRGH